MGCGHYKGRLGPIQPIQRWLGTREERRIILMDSARHAGDVLQWSRGRRAEPRLSDKDDLYGDGTGCGLGVAEQVKGGNSMSLSVMAYLRHVRAETK